MVICANPACLKPTRNKRFCSRGCSATVTNSESPRRVATIRPCAECGEPTHNKRVKLCRTCNKKSVTRLNIGTASRALYFSVFPKLCCICGYALIVEVDHIVPRRILDDPWDAVQLENLAGLCPNHHKEKTYGMLSCREVINAMAGVKRLELS